MQEGRGRMAGAWRRKKWVFGMFGVRCRGNRPGKPVLGLKEQRTRRELVPLIAHHAGRGSTILSDQWRQEFFASAWPKALHGKSQCSICWSRNRGSHSAHWKGLENKRCGDWGETALRNYWKTVAWVACQETSTNMVGPLGRLLHDIGSSGRLIIINWTPQQRNNFGSLHCSCQKKTTHTHKWTPSH